MTYRCRISDKKGKISIETAEVQKPEELGEYWDSRNCYLLSYDISQRRDSLLGRQGKNRAVREMTQSLALLIDSGLTLKEAFEITTSLFTKGKTSLLVSGICESLRRGDSFSGAVEDRREIFPSLYRGMIQVGEKLGQLDKILPSLALWMEKDKTLADRIKAALLYPIMVMVLLFAGMAGLLLFFLPYMEEMMLSAGEESVENLARAYSSARLLMILFFGLLLMTPLITLILFGQRKRHPALAVFLDRIKLQIPLLKRFLLTRDMLSLSFALAILTECGVALEESLLQASEVLENRTLRASLVRIRNNLLQGRAFSELLEKEGLFPPEFSHWTALGERIGRVDRVFTQLRHYYQKEMDYMLNLILTMAEPLIILLLGVLLTVIIINVILPLLTLYGGNA